MVKNNTIQNNNNNNNNNDNNDNYRNNTNNNRNNNNRNNTNKNNNNNNNNNANKDGGVILVNFGESFGGLGAVMGASNLVELQTRGCFLVNLESYVGFKVCRFQSFDDSNGGYRGIYLNSLDYKVLTTTTAQKSPL